MGRGDDTGFARRLAASTRGASSTEYLTLAAFGAFAVATAFAAFGGAVGDGLFPGSSGPSARAGGGSSGAGGGSDYVAGHGGALDEDEGGGAFSPFGSGEVEPSDVVPESWRGGGAEGSTGPSTGSSDGPEGEASGGLDDSGSSEGGPEGEASGSEASGGLGDDSGRSGGGRSGGGEPGAGSGPEVAPPAESGASGATSGTAEPTEVGDASSEAVPVGPAPRSREDAAEVLSRYGTLAGSSSGDVDEISDSHLESLLDDESMPPELRMAAAIELTHREEEGSECSGWFSTCKLKEVAGGTLDFVSGVGIGAGRALWETGKFVFKAAEYGVRINFEATVGRAFGYTPTLDKIESGVESFLDDPKGGLELGWEMVKGLGGHFVGLAKSCTTEYTARGCGESVGEIGFDVALTVATGGAGGAAKGAARAGSVASRHGATRTARVLGLAERGLWRADDAGRALRGLVTRGGKGAHVARHGIVMGSRKARRARAERLVVARGTATAEDVKAARKVLEGLPDGVLRHLEQRDIRVAVGRGSVTDVLPELKGVRPRGWPKGKTWDSVTGTVWNNEVVLATRPRRTWYGRRGRRLGDVRGDNFVPTHEIGHALDRTGSVGAHSLSDDFVRAYDADMPKLTGYERQAGAAGKSEAYAESFRKYVTGDRKFRRTQPHLWEYWDNDPRGLFGAAGQ